MKDNEKSDKKLNRALISMLAFITVCVFLCLYFSITLYADENINLASKYPITSMLTASDYPEYQKSNGRVLFLYSDDTSRNRNEGFLNNNQLVISSASDYIFDSNLYYWNNQGVYGATPGSFIVVNPDSVGSVMYFNASDYTTSTPYSYLMTTSSTPTVGNVQITNNNRVTVDGVSMLRFGGDDTNYCLYNTNLPVYVTDSPINSITSTEGLEQINPNYSPADQESAHNNLYLKEGYFVWNTPAYVKDTLAGDMIQDDNITKGTVTFNYQLTDYQKQNPSQFTMLFKYNLQYNVGSYINGKAQDARWFGYYTPAYSYISVPFTDLNNNQYYTINMSDLTSDFYEWFQPLTSRYSPMFTTIQQENSYWYLELSAVIVANDEQGRSYTDKLNFLNNTVSNQSKGITQNDFPFNGNTEDADAPTSDPLTTQTGFGNVPTGGNSNSNGNGSYTSNGNGGVYVDNRFTNNNNNNNNASSMTDYVKQNLAGEDDDSFTNQLASMSESNSFMDYMESCFGFIPSGFWDTFGDYFEIFLGILLAYFVFRLILDIL